MEQSIQDWLSRFCGRQPLKIWRDMVCRPYTVYLSRPYPFKFFKGYLPKKKVKKVREIEGNLSKISHKTLKNQKPIPFIFSVLENRIFCEVFCNSNFYYLYTNYKKNSVLMTNVIIIWVCDHVICFLRKDLELIFIPIKFPGTVFWACFMLFCTKFVPNEVVSFRH